MFLNLDVSREGTLSPQTLRYTRMGDREELLLLLLLPSGRSCCSSNLGQPAGGEAASPGDAGALLEALAWLTAVLLRLNQTPSARKDTTRAGSNTSFAPITHTHTQSLSLQVSSPCLEQKSPPDVVRYQRSALLVISAGLGTFARHSFVSPRTCLLGLLMLFESLQDRLEPYTAGLLAVVAAPSH